MNQYSENEKLNLFKSLFKGREDVFAIHWQKGNKSGQKNAGFLSKFAKKKVSHLTSKDLVPVKDWAI